MKYLSIWKDIHPMVTKHGNEYMLNHLITLNGYVDIGIMCAEEASMHDIQPFLNKQTMSKFNRAYMVQGGYDLKYYDIEGITKFSNIDFNIWPWYFIFESSYHSSVALDLPVDKLFICMNYKPRQQRKRLLDQLAKVNLLDSNYVTWHQPTASENFDPDHFFEDQYAWKHWVPQALYLEGTTWDQYCVPRQMFNSVINLVTESFLHCPFATEKTWNSIFAKKPFIILGYPGIHNWLVSQGYKLPSQINYQFDLEQDDDTRIKMIVEELRRLSQLDLQELNDSMKDVCEHNYQHACKFIQNYTTDSNPINEYYGDIIDRAKHKLNIAVRDNRNLNV
tara:strand:+ start:298 stop:1302 length:1005 start_codon:yes stop_codon:yes gene_type:complete